MLKLEDSLLPIITFCEFESSSNYFGSANWGEDQQVSQHGVHGEGGQGVVGGGGAHKAALIFKCKSQI